VYKFTTLIIRGYYEKEKRPTGRFSLFITLLLMLWIEVGHPVTTF